MCSFRFFLIKNFLYPNVLMTKKCFAQIIFLHQNLTDKIAAINLTTLGPLYTCLTLIFKKRSCQHSLINNLCNNCSIPKGSPQLPNYKTDLGKTSIKYICSIGSNMDKYIRDPYWINNTRLNSFQILYQKSIFGKFLGTSRFTMNV